MRGKTKKATFSLDTKVLAEMDAFMEKGAAPSKNALVEKALRKELEELKRQDRRRLWQEAAKDDLFVKDLAEVAYDFQYADADTPGGMDK